MNAFTHLLNIGTLATWLSVAGFGTVGLLVPGWRREPAAKREMVTSVVQENFTISAEENPGEPKDTAPAAATAETLPAPPDLPDLTDLPPLPEIPELPAAEPSSAPKPAARSSSTPKSSGTNRGQATRGKPAGSGISNAARIAAGSMPSPSYPAEAKRKNQTGTVVIEFTVDASGRVISAYPKSSTGWPLLDAEAVRTVRRWTFPPGGVMKLQRPIVFQLR